MSCPVCGAQEMRQPELALTGATLHRCAGCRAVYRDRVAGLEAAEYYHDYYKGKPAAHDPITAKRYHVILDRFERLRLPGRLLDVGCGAGHFLVVAESRGWRATGLEVSGSGVEILAELKRERGWGFEILGEDLLKADLPASSFTAVTLFEVLEHLADPVANLEKIHRLLEPGGLLYLTTPNFDSLPRYALGGRWRAITPEHLCLFTPAALRRCLQASGFMPMRLVTKNVDVPEILAKWRVRRRPDQPVATFEATRVFRHTVERSRPLRWLKSGANAVLRLSGLGETIEALAVRDANAHSRHRD